MKMHDKQGSMACRAQDDDVYTYSKNSFFSDSVMPFPAVFRLFLFYYIFNTFDDDRTEDTFGKEKSNLETTNFMCKNEEISCVLYQREKFPNLHLCIGTSTLSAP